MRFNRPSERLGDAGSGGGTCSSTEQPPGLVEPVDENKAVVRPPPTPWHQPGPAAPPEAGASRREEARYSGKGADRSTRPAGIGEGTEIFDRLGEFGATVQDRFDLWQQRVPVLGFPTSVRLRYREDRCDEYAALLSYCGLFSVFPLLTVGVTIVGFALTSRPDLRAELLDTIFSRFPVVGEELSRQMDALEGNGLVLAGIGVVRVAQMPST